VRALEAFCFLFRSRAVLGPERRISGATAALYLSHQTIEEFSRDPAAVGITEADEFLVSAVKIAAAGLDQAKPIREARALVDPGSVVIAVEHFDTCQSNVHQVLHDPTKLSIVVRAKLDGMCEDGKTAGLMD
jgi:hypothetical protein